MTSSTDSVLALAWITWVAVHKLKLATKRVRHSLMWRLVRKLGGKRNGPKKKTFSMCRRRRSDPAVQIGEVSCSVHVRMGDAKE